MYRHLVRLSFVIVAVLACISLALPLGAVHGNTAYSNVMAELDQTTTTTTTTTTPTTTSSQQKPIEALTTEVQWLETQLSNNTPVDQLQSHWTAFSQKLAKQSPDAGQYLDTINEIVSRFSSPQEWKQLVNTLKKKVEQSQPLSTATQAAHQNQATW